MLEVGEMTNPDCNIKKCIVCQEEFKTRKYTGQSRRSSLRKPSSTTCSKKCSRIWCNKLRHYKNGKTNN